MSIKDKYSGYLSAKVWCLLCLYYGQIINILAIWWSTARVHCETDQNILKCVQVLSLMCIGLSLQWEFMSDK